MTRRKIVPYKRYLKSYARLLRKKSTKSEILLWSKLKRKQLFGYDFHRQKPIDNYILDFYCHELNLGIELDGYSHELIEVFEKDSVKTKRLKELGVIVLRFSDRQVFREMDNVLRTIEFFIEEHENKINYEK